MEPQHYVTTKQQLRRGYITLVSVMVVGAVGLAIAVSLILLGVGSSRTSFSLQQSDQAKGLADSCVELALGEIRNLTSFSGSNTITFGAGNCTYTVTKTGGQNRTIDAQGTVEDVVRRDKVFVDKINPIVNITSWQEVADF